MQYNFSRNVAVTEQNFLRYFIYIGTSAHCANWLVKLTLGVKISKCIFLIFEMMPEKSGMFFLAKSSG
jgi:hypothetical protein